MIIYHIILLAIIQGLTEFLPVSSSGHLGLFHCLTEQCSHWDEENMAMDVAVHVGTLFAVLLYFRQDVLRMLVGLKDIITGNVKSQDAKLLLFVLVGSIPVIIAGLALHAFEPDWLKTMYVIAWCLIIFGILLWIADTKTTATKTAEQMTYKDVLLIGLAQILALIPGVSRSGITMTAARFLGYERAQAARYSFLLSMVAIGGAGVLVGLDIITNDSTQLGSDILIGIFFAFLSGLGAIFVLMKILERSTFTGFAIYRVTLGSLLLILLYTGVIG